MCRELIQCLFAKKKRVKKKVSECVCVEWVGVGGLLSHVTSFPSFLNLVDVTKISSLVPFLERGIVEFSICIRVCIISTFFMPFLE